MDIFISTNEKNDVKHDDWTLPSTFRLLVKYPDNKYQ